MLDDFREWLSDNLRYILLGLGIIAAVLIVFLVVRLVTGSGSSSDNPSGSQRTVQQETAAETVENMTEGTDDASASQTQTTVAATGDLVKDDAAVKTLVQQYYTAVAAGDTGALASIVEPWNDEVQSQVLGAGVIESYENITTYSKNGLQDGEFVVFAYYEAKLPNIETTVPSLSMLYLSQNSSGTLIINANRESDSEISAFTAQAASDADVQALIAQVNQSYETAVAQDEALSSYITSIDGSSNDTDENDGNSGDSADADTSAGMSDASVGETLTATTTLNIRQTASTSAAIMGVLPEGTSVTTLSGAENGWVQIEYQTSAGTIQGYVMLEYMSAAGTASAAQDDTAAGAESTAADDAA